VLEQNEDLRGVGIALARLADAAIADGDFPTAYLHLARCLRINKELGEPAGIAFVLVRFAHLAAAQGQATRALRLAGAAATLRDEAETVLAPAVLRRLEEQIAPARRALGPRAEGTLRRGRRLSLDAAIAEALATVSPDPENWQIGTMAPLSPREREIAALIGRGYTNKRIADELVIGEATVATHVQHILAKLELGSRAQIAVWAERRQLIDQPTGGKDSVDAMVPG
jgi:DNA-binding NarL/FixJ family response regulator